MNLLTGFISTVYPNQFDVYLMLAVSNLLDRCQSSDNKPTL